MDVLCPSPYEAGILSAPSPWHHEREADKKNSGKTGKMVSKPSLYRLINTDKGTAALCDTDAKFGVGTTFDRVSEVD